MTLSDAREVLAAYLPAGDVTAEAIRAAFAAAVRANHPDTGEPSHTVATIKEARDILLRNAGAEPVKACPVCRGSGYQMQGFQRVACVRGCRPA